MKGYLILFLIIFFLALSGKSLFGLCLVLPFVLAAGIHFPGRTVFGLAFFSGLLLSLIGGTALGMQSIGLLLATGIIHIYARRFSRKHFLFFLVFSFGGSLLYSLVVGRSNLFQKGLIDMVFSTLFLPLVSRLEDKFFSESVVLKV